MADRVAELAAELEAELDDALTGDHHAPRDAGRAATALERAVAACRSDPRIAEEFDLPGLLDELAEVYAQLGRIDDALTTMRAAITAGYTSTPDPRCRLAEIQLRAGRAEPAHALFAQVHAEFPDDVWLYNNAGLEYGAAGDHGRALAWLTPGLELALATGDPERLVAQLADLREHSRTALGQPRDDLAPTPSSSSPDHDPNRPDGHHPRCRPCSPPSPPHPVPRWPPPPSSQPAHPPPGHWWHWPWPGFPPASSPQPCSSGRGSRRTGAPPTTPPTTVSSNATCASSSVNALGPTWIAPIRIEAFQRWSRRTDRDPATSDARAGYAADQARIQAHDLITWPPERNQPC